LFQTHFPALLRRRLVSFKYGTTQNFYCDV